MWEELPLAMAAPGGPPNPNAGLQHPQPAQVFQNKCLRKETASDQFNAATAANSSIFPNSPCGT